MLHVGEYLRNASPFAPISDTLLGRGATDLWFSCAGMQSFWGELIETMATRPRGWPLTNTGAFKRVPMAGGQASGLFDDLWAGPHLCFGLTHAVACDGGALMEIEGWFPDAVQGPRLTITIDGQRAGEYVVAGGIFTVQVPLPAGIMVKIDASWSHCPAHMGADDDARTLSYILRAIQCRNAVAAAG